MFIEQIELPPHLRLRTGAVSDDGSLVLLIADNNREYRDEAFTAVGLWRPGLTWEKPTWELNLISACAVTKPAPAFVLMSRSGAYVVFDASGDRITELTDELRGELNDPLPSFRSVTSIDGYAYATGFKGAVVRRDGDGSWTAITDSAIDDCDLEAVAGFSPDEIYGVGWHGCIVRFDGNRWQRIDSPTNVFLSNICCAGDGFAYAVGLNGTVVRGRDQQWEVILEDESTEEFWGIARFNDQLYISSPQFLYLVDHNKLELVQPDDEIPRSCYHLSVAKDAMLSVGIDDALLFDGRTWTRIV